MSKPYYNCDSNNIVCNLHTVPVSDVLTFGTLFIIGIGVLVGKTNNYALSTIILLIIFLLMIDIFVHPYFDMPNNISYYFNLGPKPPGWKY